jgi:hypothetical protein
MVRKRNLVGFLILSLGMVYTLLSCTGYLSSTIYPAYIQRADKVLDLSEIKELSWIEGKEFDAKIRHFVFPQGNVVGIRLRFKEKGLDDQLVLLTENLSYLRSYNRLKLNLPAGYRFSNLFGEGYGDRILIGVKYHGDDPAEQSRIVAIDPSKDLSESGAWIMQPDTDEVCIEFLTGISTGNTGGGPYGSWIVRDYFPNLNFTRLPESYLPPTPPPPSSGVSVSVFNDSRGFTLVDYVKDPETDTTAVLVWAGKEGWVFYDLPLGGDDLAGLSIYDRSAGKYFSVGNVERDDMFFYTREGAVKVKDNAKSMFFPFTEGRSSVEGPEISKLGSLTFRFTINGRWFYIFDSDTLRIIKAKTWW